MFCKGLVKEEECLEVLKNMTSDKTPGTDGLPCDFIKFSGSDVNETLINDLNHSCDAGMLSISQRRGVIKLMPKKILKNWRPITLFNFYHKIATKAIASQTKTMLLKFIPGLKQG